MIPWEILPEAQVEMQAAFAYYNAIDPAMADHFYGNLVTLRNQARVNPFMHHIRRQEIRRINLGPRFQEWYLAYILLKGQLVILAVAHAKQKPYYFSGRIDVARKLF